MIWIGALVLFGYWLVFHTLTAVVLSFTPAPGATVPSFSQEFLDSRKANVDGTALKDCNSTVNPAALGDRQQDKGGMPRQSDSGPPARFSIDGAKGKPPGARISHSGSINKVHVDLPPGGGGFPRPSADGKV